MQKYRKIARKSPDYIKFCCSPSYKNQLASFSFSPPSSLFLCFSLIIAYLDIPLLMLVIMKTMKKVVLFLSLFACTFIMSSCNNQRHWQASLDAAYSMVDERPDSALTILDSLERHSGDFSKPTEMRWHLLRLKAQNKCDTVFRSV